MLNYTADYTTPHIPFWQEVLGPPKGQPIAMLELGCFEGRSSRWFRENLLTNSQSYLHCVDTWMSPDVLERFKSNMGGLLRVYAYRDNSRFLVNSGPYDVIYLDADHKPASVLIDACNCWQALKPGGILIFDDYRLVDPSRAVEVKSAVDAFCGLLGLVKQHSPWHPDAHHPHDWGQVAVRKSL